MSELRRRLLQRHPLSEVSELEQLLLETIVDGADMDTQRRRDYLEAVRNFDARAALAEELTIRLLGPGAQGGLRFELGDSLLRPFQDTVGAVADHAVSLELTGVSPGSTVLHVRAVDHQEGSVDGNPVDSSAADTAMRETLRLFAALEHEADLGPYAEALTPVGRFLDVLQKNALNVTLTWAASDGEVREAEVTERGRAYFARIAQTQVKSAPMPLIGRVTELRSSGVARVKTGTNKKSPAYDVHFEPGQLIDMHLSLGDLVHFMVSRTVESDRLGRELAVRHEFVRVLSRADELDLGLD